MTQTNTTKKVVKPYGLDEDQPASNKWTAVAGLLLVTIVLLGLFLRFVFAPDKPKVHLATVFFADYAERLLPKPAFVDWQIDWEKAKHFQPWSGSAETGQLTIKTADEFFRVPTAIQAFLFGNGQHALNEEDTLIVYLRGLSLVQRNTENSAEDKSTGDSSELVLLASEYDPVDKPKAYVPIAQMLGDLKKLPLKHIVVLADIHDLLVAPKLGYPRNDVGQALKAAVGSLQRNDGAELWVVAAADSGQPSHISYLQKKTLLQSAVEYSLRENQPENREPLALTDFFQKVFDYSRAASENYQTPLLLLNGSSQPVRKDTTPDDWKLASKVSIVQPPDKSLTADKGRSRNDTDQEEKNEDSTAASSKPKSAEDDPKSATDGQVTGGDSSAPVVETKPAEQEPVEKDIRLRFWQLRDQIARDAVKDPTRPPTPSSFAADRWQHLIREATAYERLCWALDAESEKRKEYEQKIADLVNELNDFHAIRLADDSLATSTFGDSLSVRWSQIRNQLDNRFSERRVWLDHGLLDKDLQEPWKVARRSLLTLADAACQLPFWFELSLHPDLQKEMPRIVSGSLPLFEEIRENTQRLAGRRFLLSTKSSGPPSIDLGKFQSQKDELDQCVEELVEKLSTKKLNWRDERTIQVLLSSSLLDWKQHKELSKYFGLSESNLEPVIIRTSDPSTPQGQSIGSATFTFLDDFFQQLHQQSEPSPTEQDPWKPWLLSCIDHLRPKHAADRPSDAKQQDLLLPGSDDQTLQVLNFPTTQRVSRSFEFEIRRRNGTSLKQCWIRWRTESTKSNDNVASLKVDSSGKSLPFDQPIKQIVLESNKDRFKLSTKLASQTESLRTDTQLMFEFSDAQPQASTSGPSNKKAGTDRSVVQRNLTLQPQPAEEFELIIDRWEPVAGQAEQDKQRMIDPDTIATIARGVEPALEVPAVGQAKAQYQFSLRNRQDRDRRVQVKLYPVIAPSQQDWTGGTGRVSELNQTYTRNLLKGLKPIAEITEVQLPDASKDSSKPVRLEFPVIASDAASPSKQPAASYGLLLLVEELKEPTSAGDQPPTGPPTVWQLSGERQFFWLDCKFSNPFDSKFVALEPRLLDDHSLEITVSVPDPTKWWTYWGLPKLGIKGLLTDENGHPLSSGSTNSVTLDQKNPQMNMTFKLNTKEMRKRPEKMVVHLDIGEYPRAIAYEWSKGSNQPQSANRSFFWLGQPNISQSSRDTSGQPPPNQQLSEPGRWIIPYREKVSEKSVGNDLPNGLLTIPFQVDFPKNNQSSACTIEFQQERIEYETDRRFEPAFEILDGRLQMSAKAMDHQWSKDISEISGDGEFPIHFSMADQEPKKMLTIVRDTQPPEDESSVRINPRGLDSDASLTIELAPKDKDDLSPIHHVYFAINRPFEDKSPVYDDEDIGFEPPKEAQRDKDGAFRLELTAAELEKAIEKSLGRPTIDKGYDIVARSVDAAGNIQDKHRSARFIWKGPKPVAKTKKEKAKPEPPPPAPEVPKLFTITVVVKQEGKTPLYPENIDVNGPGDRRSHLENRIVFTDVPAGAAEYKAVYTPPIGNVFEAQKSINVTKNQTIELDTKLKK